ncbi:SH3 domain-containing protein [Croceicoccus sp. F390]|uniref:SH3 domain-containing protein n=1 Tax=Croceicoccus esteveae TaxID=3075597 RepID=A0ABU2ZJV3_9SPHN|nr:SH3 domain-containing protein [Croceicoccus sp. F390]MDT0575672.1 SH3 domain-containing protein [Croceicoccus sp. F390]
MTAPPQSFMLCGPTAKKAHATLPARGDLAHIGLAGIIFAPYYAIPMPHRARKGSTISVAADPEAAACGQLAASDVFDVLDIAGDWAWGGTPCGQTGYVPAALLEPLS